MWQNLQFPVGANSCRLQLKKSNNNDKNMYAMSARSVRVNQNKRFARNISVSQLQIPEKCVILEVGVNPCIFEPKTKLCYVFPT